MDDAPSKPPATPPAAVEADRARRLRHRRGPLRFVLDALIAVVLPACAISAVYLAPFVRDPGLLPFGADTPGYIWRIGVVRSLGLHALSTGTFPPPIQPLGSRPGYPVIAGILQSIAGIDPATFAWLSPAIFATVAGLAAGALAVDGCKEPRIRAPLYAIGVGGSSYLAWTAVGYAPNLAFDGVALAIAVVMVTHRRGRGPPVLGAAMLGAGFLIHWMFASTFAALLLAYAGIVALARRRSQEARERRESHSGAVAAPTKTALRGLALMLIVSVLIGAAILLVASPERPDSLPPVNQPGRTETVVLKLVARDPGALLWTTVSLAAVAVVLGVRSTRRWSVILVGLWAGLVLAGLVAWYVLRLPTPPYRWSAFALGLPILAIAAGPWGAEAAGRRLGRGGHIAGVAVAIAVSATLVGAGIHVWWSKASQMTPEDRVQLAMASRYLDPLPAETPVVVVVAPSGRRLPIDRVFSGLPPERLPHVQLVGALVDPQAPDLGLGIPLSADAVVLFPRALNHRDVTMGMQLGPGLRLLAGPAPGAAIDVPPAPTAPGLLRLAWYVALCLATLTVAGWGWSLLVDVPVAGRLALAPAVGTAMLGLVGEPLAWAGVRPDGMGAVVLLALTMASGAAAAAIVSARDRRDGEASPTPAEGSSPDSRDARTAAGGAG